MYRLDTNQCSTQIIHITWSCTYVSYFAIYSPQYIPFQFATSPTNDIRFAYIKYISYILFDKLDNRRIDDDWSQSTDNTNATNIYYMYICIFVVKTEHPTSTYVLCAANIHVLYCVCCVCLCTASRHHMTVTAGFPVSTWTHIRAYSGKLPPQTLCGRRARIDDIEFPLRWCRSLTCGQHTRRDWIVRVFKLVGLALTICFFKSRGHLCFLLSRIIPHKLCAQVCISQYFI